MSSLNKKQAQQLISESTLQQYNRDISRNQNENRQNIHLNNTIQFSLQSVIGYHCSSSQCIKNSIRQSKSTESNKIFDNIPSKGIIGHIYNKNIYYYINNMFIRMNVYTRNTKPIYQQIQIEGKVQLLKFCDYGKQTIFMAIKRKADTLYMSIIWPDRIDSDKQFNSKQKATVYKIGQYKNKRVVNVGYHHEKKYLVFLWQEFVNGFTKQPQLQNSIQIFQINNKCIKVVLPLYNLKISKNSSKAKQTAYFQQSNLFKLTNVIILPDYKEIYIYGKQYFRYWSIDYHEKTMHASNFRGIERALKGQQVLTSYIFNKNKFQQPKRTDCNKQNNIIVALFTHKQCFFVKKNEIIKRINIPTESSLTVANLKNQATQLAIQKSLNQIYKSKFRMQTFSDDLQDMIDENTDDNNNTQNRGTYICCISAKQWTEKSATFSELDRKNEDNKKIAWFCAVTSDKKILINYIDSNMTIKIQTVLNISQSYFDEGIFRKYISSSKNGSLILFHDYLGDMLLANTDDQNYQVKPIYGDSSPHQNQIVSISSPQLNQIMTTVDSQGCIKVWKIFERYKSLIFNYKPKNRPINVKMHPSGLLLAANFGHQIKIYGIVSEQFEQLAAIKTNDFCSSITFSGITQFLISNQKSFIKLYEPFTLQCHHRIEPQDLKLQIKSFKVSQNGEFIVYQCCNKKVYMYTLSNFAKKQQIIIREQVNEKDESNKNSSLFCHHQSQIYNCFYFDFGKSKDFQTYQKQKNLDFLKSQRDTGPNYKSMYRKNINQDKANMFVGFTQNKYMVLYGNYGQRLIAQFSIQECFVTDLYQDKNLLFVGTNKGTIRTYDWPIFEEFLQMRIYEDDNAQKKARIIAPQYKQFCVWKDKSPITCLHKLSEQNKLIVGNKHGCLGLINFCYNRSQREKYPTSHNLNIKLDNCLSKNSQKDHQRIKLGQTMCSLKYIKLTQQQRINKLIQKTQNDIIKLQYQINREKNQKMLQLQKEKKQQQQNFQRKAQQQNQQYSLYCSQQNRQIRKLKQQYQKKKKSLKEYLQNSQKISSQKICYQQNRLNDIKNLQMDQRNRYRKMIGDVADRHKVDIQNMKKQYWNKIKILQNQLQQFIQKQLSNNHVQVVPFQLKQHKTANLPPSIYESMLRVEQLAHQLQSLQNKLECLQKSHKNFGEEDSTLQKQFQQALEKYNKGRFQILNLHSEVLKMQNQLLERKQILEKKDSVISVIKYEKQVNQTYKVFAKGGIIGVQKAKEIAYIQYLKKQDQLKSLFKELQSEIYRGQQQKVKISNDKMMIRILQKQVKQKNVAIQNLRQKLDGLKKVLLLQGLGESAQQKQVYHEQQKLLVAIKWLQKRFKMTCINQKKLINLKQQGVAQIIKQNKHLLQQCNQLREQGIQYQNQINHLSQKLAQANKIIDLQKKVSTQKGDINKQTMKLQQIRKIFSKQLHMLSSEDPELSAIL